MPLACAAASPSATAIAISTALRQLQRRSSQARPQRFAVQQLRYRVRDSLLVAEIVNRQDVGMRKGRRRLGLDLKARQRFRMRGEMLGKDLHRDRAIQPRVGRAIDFAHAAGAEPRLDPVVAERAPDHPAPPVSASARAATSSAGRSSSIAVSVS